jgi:5-methylcytosine-specific restriction endonuclease McrA
MVAIPCTIGGKRYRSKSEALAARTQLFRELEAEVKATKADPLMLQGFAFDFFRDCLENHPRRDTKVKGELVGVIFRSNPEWPNSYQVCAISSESADPIAFAPDNGITVMGHTVEAAKERDRRSRAASKREALREAVRQQSTDYKQGLLGCDDSLTCQHCGHTSGQWQFFEVDHKSPKTFAWLVELFLARKGLTFEDVELEHNIISKDQLGNELFASSWVKFHAREADLWLLCKDCHAREAVNIISPNWDTALKPGRIRLPTLRRHLVQRTH